MNIVYRVEITIDSAPPQGGRWSDPIPICWDNPDQYAALSVYGDSWEGTITLQRSLDEGLSWRDIDIFKANEETGIIERLRKVLYRVGMKEGDYVSGTVTAVIQRD